MNVRRMSVALVLIALMVTGCSVAPGVEVETGTDAAASPTPKPDNAPTEPVDTDTVAGSEDTDGDDSSGISGDVDPKAAGETAELEAEKDRITDLIQERQEESLVAALDADNPAPVRPDNVPPDTEATARWASGPIADAETISLAGPTSIFTAHELIDGTVLGIGPNTLWLWNPSEPDQPRSFASGVSFPINSIILDDEWLIMSGTGTASTEPEDNLIEFWSLDDLESGPTRTENQFVGPESMVAVGDGVFVMSRNGTDPDSHSLWVRTMSDLDEGDQLLTKGYVGYLTLLQDNHVAGTGVYVVDPAEPEREREEYIVTSGYGPEELADGRLVIGWDASWWVIDRDSGDVTELPYDRLDRNVARPVGTADGRMLMNTDWGIDLYEIDDLETPVARYTPPADSSETAIFPAPIFIVDQWMVTSGLGVGGYVWDLTQPDVPAVPFGSAEPLLALSDGRILSNSDLGPVLWNPASVFAGASEEIGRLCRIAELDDRTIVTGTASGDILWWNWREDPDGEHVVIAHHTEEISQIIALDDNRIATASLDGTVQVFNPNTDVAPIVFTYPGGAVLSLALLDDGRLAVGGSEGTVALFDPDEPELAPVIVFRGEGSSAMSLGALDGNRISVGIFENFLRIYDATENAQVKKLGLEGVAFGQTVGSDGRIYVPLTHLIAAFNPAAPAQPPIELPVPTGSYSVPAELSDGRFVIVDSAGVIRIIDPDDKAAVFASHGMAAADSRCTAVLHDDLLAFTTGAELRIVDISAALS